MEEEYLDVTARLETSDGVRFRAYLLASRNGRIAVGTVLHTLDERANPVLALLEHSCMPQMKPNSVGWLAARVLLSGDIQVTVAGSQIELNADQVNAINMYNKEYPIQIVDSAYGAGKSVCAAIMAEESAKKRQIILVTAVQNSALDVIGAKIAELQSEHIRAVGYVSEILAQGTLEQSPFALRTHGDLPQIFSTASLTCVRGISRHDLLHAVSQCHPRIPVALINILSYSVQSVTGSNSNIAEATTAHVLVCFLLAKGFAAAQSVDRLYRDENAADRDTISSLESPQTDYHDLRWRKTFS
ncbi:hypothetical protein OSTOST_05812 [Ostertagia ostertagi]